MNDKVWSRVSFGKILSATSQPVHVQNEAGLDWLISRDIFDKEFTVADEFTSEGETNRTEIQKKILEYPRTAMTIAFRKKVEPKHVIDAVKDYILETDPKDLPRYKNLGKAIRTAMKGEERIMKGRHHGHFDSHGRLRVVDMEDPKRIEKSVDLRTVEWAIVKGVKYVVK